MKKFKKLIPALCMLLVSAVMLGSTTFAWFSMNRTVTATGMEIKAEVPTQLLISADNSTWGNTMTFASEKTLNPKGVAPVTAKSLLKDGTLVPTFYKLTDQGMKLVNESGKLTGITGTLGETYDYAADTTNFVTTEQDVFIDTFHLKLAGKVSEEKNLVAKVKVSSESADAESLDLITKALHIVIVEKTTNETTTTQTVLVNQDLGDLLTGDNALSIAKGEGKDLTIGTVFTFAQDNESKTLGIYVFYDGNDNDCLNTNAAIINGLKFNFTFELAK